MTEVLFNPAHQLNDDSEREQRYELDREYIFTLGALATVEAVVANQQLKPEFNAGEFPADQTANID